MLKGRTPKLESGAKAPVFEPRRTISEGCTCPALCKRAMRALDRGP